MQEGSSSYGSKGSCCGCHHAADISGHQPLPFHWQSRRQSLSSGRRESHKEAASRNGKPASGLDRKQSQGPLAGLLEQIDRGRRHARETVANYVISLVTAHHSIAASLAENNGTWTQRRRRTHHFRPRRKRLSTRTCCSRDDREAPVFELPEFVRGLTSDISGILCQRAREWQGQLTGDMAPPLIHTLLASVSTAALAATMPSPKSGGGKGSSPYKGLPSPPVGTPAAPLRPRRAVKTGQKKPKWVKEPPPSSLELAREIALASAVNWSGFIRPVDKIWEVSSDFGPRWGRHHNGVDLAAPYGEPVLAADCGTITFAGWEPSGYGYLVEITHKDGWRTLYAHNSSIYTWEGQMVKQGDCIASVGATGRATGPHLHWEIRNRWGSPVDPAGYVEL